MPHLPAIRIGAVAGIAAADVGDTVHDEAARANIVGSDLAVDAVEQRSAGCGWQCRPWPDRGLTAQFFVEPGAYRGLVGDGAGRIDHRGLTPVVVLLPRHRLLDDLEPQHRHPRVVKEKGGEAVAGAV